MAKTNEQNNRQDNLKTHHFDEGRTCGERSTLSGEPPCQSFVQRSHMLMQKRPLLLLAVTWWKEMDVPIAETVSTYVTQSSPRQTVCLFKNLTLLRPQVCLKTNLLTMITTRLIISHHSGKSQQHQRRAIL